MNTNVERLGIVAEGLGLLPSKVVFVGGAVASLYVDLKGAPEFRPTDDVDCIVEMRTRAEFETLSAQLRNLGFMNDSRQGAPICRWIYRGITVDIMPLTENILGFSNRWYEEGYTNHETIALPDGSDLKILPVPYFIATKLEAFNSRGQGDYRNSSDIEDVVFVMDGCADCVLKIQQADPLVKEFLVAQFERLTGNRDFEEAVHGCFPRQESARVGGVLTKMRSVCDTSK